MADEEYTPLEVVIILSRLAVRVTVLYWLMMVCTCPDQPRQPWIPPSQNQHNTQPNTEGNR